MKYYKVKKESDNKRIFIKKGNVLQVYHKRSILVANELITVKEANKQGLTQSLSKHANLVEINKNNTYFFFGCRFSL